MKVIIRVSAASTLRVSVGAAAGVAGLLARRLRARSVAGEGAAAVAAPGMAQQRQADARDGELRAGRPAERRAGPQRARQALANTRPSRYLGDCETVWFKYTMH